MNTPNRRASTVDQLGAYLEHIGQTNRATARVAAFGQIGLVALAAVNLRNLVSSPLCWLGIASGTVVAFLLWALLTRRMTVRGALVGISLWLVIEFAIGLFVPWDPTIGDAAITVGVIMGMILSFALLQLRGSFRSAAH